MFATIASQNWTFIKSDQINIEHYKIRVIFKLIQNKSFWIWIRLSKSSKFGSRAHSNYSNILYTYFLHTIGDIFKLENLSVWQILVFRYGLMINRWCIEFETLEKLLVISMEY
jgi:hypothetical protein